MPKNEHKASLARQWDLMRAIPTRTYGTEGKAASELRESLDRRGYSVTLRTVERDLNVVRAVFPLRFAVASNARVWYWEKRTFIGVSGLDVTTALSLALARDTLRRTLPEELWQAFAPLLAHAKEKLEEVSKTNPAARWKDKVRFVPAYYSLLNPRVDLNILECIQEALLQDRQIEISYAKRKSESQESNRILYPRALIHRGPVTYLVADSATDKPKMFATHRFKKVSVTDSPVPKSAFKLDDFIDRGGGQVGDGTEIILTAAITDHLATTLRETPLSPKCEVLQENGQTIVRAPVTNNVLLWNWILAQGDNIEVLSPDHLRTLIASRIRKAADRYA